MKVLLQESICIGCGSCVDMAPDYFVMNEAGKAAILDAAISGSIQSAQVFPDDKLLIESIVTTCPVKCIEVSFI